MAELRNVAVRTAFWVPWAIATYFAFASHAPDAVSRVSDVVLHAFAFTYLTAALWLAHFPLRGPLPTIAGMAAWGLGIELIQSFLPARSAELKDLMVDALGITAGVLLYHLARRGFNLVSDTQR